MPDQFQDKPQAPPLKGPEESKYEFPYSPLHEPEESKPDVVTLSFRRDDPILEALVAATGKDAESVLAHAIQTGVDFIKLEAMEMLTHAYAEKVAGLETRLQVLKDSVQAAAGAPTEGPKPLMKRFWDLLTTKEED